MDREELERKLQDVFSWYDRLSQGWSSRWRQHANRRTLIVIVLFGALATSLYLTVIRPPDEFPVGVLVEVKDGLSLSEVAQSLKAQKVIRSPRALQVLAKIMRQDRNMHAGDYLFKEPRDLFSVTRAVSVGAFGLEPIRIRIHEGATTKEMSKRFSANLQRFDEENFFVLARPLEGFLFPDTYFFLPNANEELVVKTMKQNFDEQITALQTEIDAFGKPLPEVITMASLLEREAHKSYDRRMISGVLWNRIKKGMLLQVDAAFLYTLGRATYQLTMEDLTSDTPYNTYRYKGLPPGAIGSPGIDAIRAAVTPVKHEYLYYLADRSGTTHYSKTYAEHLRKKRLYID